MNKPTARLALYLLSPLLFFVLSTGYIIYSLTMNNHRAMAEATSRRHVEKAQQQIASKLDSALKDLTFFSFVHESYEVFTKDINADLKETFMTLCYNRQNYDQIGYINKQGQEIFRINDNNGFPRIVFKEDLQFKGGRSFFTNSIGLKLNELYISPMELNTEGGIIEKPHKPILRLASPVTDPDGITVGIFLIDFLSKPLLDALNDVSEGTKDVIMLLNSDGYWLKGPSPDQEWGFVLDKKNGPSFAKSHAREWDVISKSDHGHFSTDGGLFTFATVDLTQSISKSTKLWGTHTAPLWKIVSWTPPEVLQLLSRRLLKKIVSYSGAILFMATLFVITLAAQRARRASAEALVVKQIESNARFVPREFLGLLDKGELTEIHISDNVQRSMTILFTDIRSYTTISESMDPQILLSFLNSYYGILDPIISRNNGFIDAFIGDAVMALFPGGAKKAILAAIDIRIALRDFHHQSGHDTQTGLNTGFGLHCGEVTLGAVGTNKRMQTTAIGDAVNLAARIEALTKLFGVSLIISSEVCQELPSPSGFKIRSIDLVRVKGKQEVVELFEVFDADPPKILQGKSESLDLFNEAMRLYREGNFQRAIEKLTLCQKICPEDTIPAIYITRCSTMQRLPPGDTWTGISTM